MAITVMAHGVYDLVHFGHILHFQAAAKLGNRLVVSVTSDRWVNKGPGRPVFGERERMEVIRNLRCVDAVILSDAENSVDVIMRVRPNIYVKGADYAKGDKTGNLAKEKAAVESYGGRFVIVHNDIVYSSTDILHGDLLARRIKACAS